MIEGVGDLGEVEEIIRKFREHSLDCWMVWPCGHCIHLDN